MRPLSINVLGAGNITLYDVNVRWSQSETENIFHCSIPPHTSHRATEPSLFRTTKHDVSFVTVKTKDHASTDSRSYQVPRDKGFTASL